ncbi:hypothetical protein BJ165DRAFT_932370 [Panaeolus papilionaceus]|nr:hypothetical protein BJ165DRAFT_932370 [Panaeolus papilionaceus]
MVSQTVPCHILILRTRLPPLRETTLAACNSLCYPLIYHCKHLMFSPDSHSVAHNIFYPLPSPISLDLVFLRVPIPHAIRAITWEVSRQLASGTRGTSADAQISELVVPLRSHYHVISCAHLHIPVSLQYYNAFPQLQLPELCHRCYRHLPLLFYQRDHNVAPYGLINNS